MLFGNACIYLLYEIFIHALSSVIIIIFVEFIYNGIHSNIIKQIYVQYKFAIKNYVTK